MPMLIESSLEVVDANPVAAPGEGAGLWYTRNLAGRRYLAIESPNGHDYAAQPHLARNPYSVWKAIGNVTTISLDRAVTMTIAGVVATVNMSTASAYARIRKVNALVTTAAATAVAGWYFTTSRLWTIGTGATALGGFTQIMRGGPATGCANASHRFAMGVTTSAVAPTDANPSTIANSIFLGYDAADTELQIISHNGTTATKVALGALFPKPTADNSVIYELKLYCGPADTTVGYRVMNVITKDFVSGTIAAADLPAATVLMAPRIYSSVGGVSAVTGVSFVVCYMEADD